MVDVKLRCELSIESFYIRQDFDPEYTPTKRPMKTIPVLPFLRGTAEVMITPSTFVSPVASYVYYIMTVFRVVSAQVLD